MAKPQSLLVIAFGAFLFGITLDLWGTLWNTALQRKVPRDSLSRVSSFDAMGSMILRPVGLAIAAPFSIFLGIENFLYALSALTAVVIALSLLSSEVRNMSFDQVQKQIDIGQRVIHRFVLNHLSHLFVPPLS